jgi:hypothetical protein
MNLIGCKASNDFIKLSNNNSIGCIMPKRKIKHVPKYLQDNKKALKAISWAFRSDLRAYPVPSGNEYHIVIENGLKRIKSPYTYKNVELTEKLWDIYIYYYDKHLEKVGYES